MKIGFVVNDLATEIPEYTTTVLAHAAAGAGHEVWIIGLGDFVYDRDNQLRAHAVSAPRKTYKSQRTYFAALTGDKASRESVRLSDLDVLMLRSNPADELERPWAQTAAIVFGELAAQMGVIVLNDPVGLADAINKMYFQHFPEQVRPRTLITRDMDDLRHFVEQEKGKAVLKPLQGSGGQGVFILKPGGSTNLNQIAEAILRDGYVVAQEYLPAAAKGDVRLFLMNGRPIEQKGAYAALRRTPARGEVRSNMHQGGRAVKATITNEMLEIADLVRPKLIQDGMFFVGLDIAGDKLMEVNVFSPGGINTAQRLEKRSFARQIIDAIERKVILRDASRRQLDNRTLATL
jgi:glutathione synthase